MKQSRSSYLIIFSFLQKSALRASYAPATSGGCKNKTDKNPALIYENQGNKK